MTTEADALKNEIEKLGAAGPARVAAVEQYIRGTAGAGAGDIIANLRTAAAVEGFEKLMAGTHAQGTRPVVPPTPPEPPPEPRFDGTKVTEEQYQRMGHAARFAYARQFSQEEYQPARGTR